MSPRVDLGKWERDAQFVAQRSHSSQLRLLSVEPEAVLALVAECRAAREAIKVLRDLSDSIVGDAMAPWPLDEIVEKRAWPALAAYDRAVSP